MNYSEPSFTFGIEEEYLLIDRASRDLAADPRPEMMEACRAALGSSVGPEFLRSQIEVATGVCSDPGEARRQLADLRGTVDRIVGRFDCALVAAATHPFGRWQQQKPTAAARYAQIAEDLRLVARRLLTCGMHVHVGIEDPELRIDLMNQAAYFLPHLLALSSSSPYWEGADTGLMSYRLSVLDELPRSGLPDPFRSAAEYDRTVAALVAAGLIEDATKLWWDIRPSARFPTLEMRVTDVCTRLEDALCIAALFRCLCRMLFRLRRNNQSWRVYSRLLVNENRWRAQRYGSDAGLVDFGPGRGGSLRRAVVRAARPGGRRRRPLRLRAGGRAGARHPGRRDQRPSPAGDRPSPAGDRQRSAGGRGRLRCRAADGRRLAGRADGRRRLTPARRRQAAQLYSETVAGGVTPSVRASCAVRSQVDASIATASPRSASARASGSPG